MKRFYITGFLVLIAFDTVAQVSFKYTAMGAEPLDFDLAWIIRVLSNPWVYGALGGYFGAFLTWMTILRHAPIGPAFAASHLELITVTMVSVWLFHEPINASKVVGGLLIILGVLCLARKEGADASLETEKS